MVLNLLFCDGLVNLAAFCEIYLFKLCFETIFYIDMRMMLNIQYSTNLFAWALNSPGVD